MPVHPTRHTLHRPTCDDPRTHPRRRRTRAVTALLALPLITLGGAAPEAAATPPATTTPTATSPTYLVGRGLADITGEPGENGMLGYGDSTQKTSGIHMRQHARAFVIVDPHTGTRLLYLLGDMLTGESKIRRDVLTALADRYGSRYGEANVMIGGIHTHATPGGTGEYSLYNVTTMGTHQDTFTAVKDGLLAAVDRAEADLAPTRINVSSSALTNASVNRSRLAFDRNPDELTARLPDGIDPRSVTLTFDRAGATVGAINWFAVHPTSLTSKNTLISTDNKGYAEWLWERGRAGVDYEAINQGGSPAMVAGFAISNGGDATANLGLKPGTGPTTDQFDNMRIIGQRQFDAAYGQLKGPRTAVTGPLDSRIIYVDMQHASAPAAFTRTGHDESTCRATLGAAFGASSTEDGGGGATFLAEGVDGNPFFAVLTKPTYDADPAFRQCQSPKATLFESGALDGVQTVVPVQVFRIGDVYLLGMPGEMTAGTGIRLQDTLAAALGTTADKVILQGVTNAYSHYFTTPEEYDRQDYEGGATIFGKWTTPTFQGVVDRLGRDLRDGRATPIGTPPAPRASVESAVGKVLLDSPSPEHQYGDQIDGTPGLPDTPGAPTTASVAPGGHASAVFVGAHPNNSVHRRSSLMQVERRDGDRWVRIADDNDFATSFAWARSGIAASTVTLTWAVPADTPAGTYRLVYTGDAKDAAGQISAIRGEGHPFHVG
ncbi:Neutral ceramidase [Austwickia sp. TVS 96-490-7B]|uniref:neutral/alkaline non-lysosomal ceramidase N-terminal domain-containing protein n=1 Tax=Austwickia sp. TVS 96-490-7B TaxID=2830843 RepID=UPI001C580A51|nr:neutral/alkaline non-lysosomal ceramidase N-terminal domain-containing protein [Austwickia sp. TVS 96-490-7B]MBW3084889.1 Neutral ceramidase [Austwickia sp. TVS 96-490-7B]